MLPSVSVLRTGLFADAVALLVGCATQVPPVPQLFGNPEAGLTPAPVDRIVTELNAQ